MIRAQLQSILRCGDVAAGLADSVRFLGADPVFPTRYRIGTAAAAALGAVGVALSTLREHQTGRRPDIEIDVRAAAASLRSSSHYVKIDGLPRPAVSSLSGFYPVAGGRWTFLHCAMPTHRDALLRVLRVPGEQADIAKAALRWEALDLEQAVDTAGACAPAVRTPEEWRALPITAALASEPLVEVRKIGDCAPMALSGAERPLSGIHALDLTRVLAGPTCTRLLAEYGADVLKITCEQHPDSPLFEWDTGYGKRTATLDIKLPAGRERFESLVRGCDVFCQAYRPDAMSRLGLSAERVAALRPGIVYASLNAYGFTGAWSRRRGFDTVVQAASGMAYISRRRDKPRLLPASSLDYVTGYLLTFGVLVALERRAKEGGSYCVNVSLARASEWITAMGLIEPDVLDAIPTELGGDELARWLIDVPSPLGTLTRLRPLILFCDGALKDLPVWRTSGNASASWSDR